MDRPSGRSLVIFGLVLLHALADIAVGAYRVRDVDREVTDVLAGALSRSQVCLLAMWLVAGSERLTWRICGLLGGCCFLFVVFTRTVFAGLYDVSSGSIWLEQEWNYYFRLSGPGDLLAKLPVLIGTVVVAWLLCHGRQVKQFLITREPGESARLRLQFGLHDAALWGLTTCLILVALFQTAPYPEWYRELGKQWLEIYRYPGPGEVYMVASGLAYVLLGFASLWLIYGSISLASRMIAGVLFMTSLMWTCQQWLERIEASLRFQPPPSEFWTGVVAGMTFTGTLATYWVYGYAAARIR